MESKERTPLWPTPMPNSHAASLDVIDARLQAIQDQEAELWALLNQVYGYLHAMNGELDRLHKRLDALEPYMPMLHRWFAMRQAIGKTLGGMRHG